MSLVCSRCGFIHETPSVCPRCGTTTNTASEEFTRTMGPRWQRTAWGRILIGLILSQGLFYGLRHLATGILMITVELAEGQNLWEDPEHQLWLQLIQGFSLLFGGMLACGAQRNGLFLGLMVGACNGALAVMLQQNPIPFFIVGGLDGSPVVHMALGMLAGLMGSFIWKPIPTTMPTLLGGGPRKIARKPKASPLAGKVAWIRVLIGTALVVAGTLGAESLLARAWALSGGKIGPSTDFQEQLIKWELKALVVLLGAVVAGSNTTNGLKQGLVVGLAASTVLIGLHVQVATNVPEMALFTLIGTASLSLVGGWFGGQLFPPVVNVKRRTSASW